MDALTSAGLRCLLENHLEALFQGDVLQRYVNITHPGNELQVFDAYAADHLLLPQLKIGYQLWSAMQTADRHAVLCYFHGGYTGQYASYACKNKTQVFCAVFIYELAAVLVEGMDHPD